MRHLHHPNLYSTDLLEAAGEIKNRNQTDEVRGERGDKNFEKHIPNIFHHHH